MVGYHRPVLLREVLDALKIIEGSWYIDATLGDGGHSLEILKQGGNIVGIDVDPEALERATKRFDKEGIDKNKWKLILGNFRNLKDLIARNISQSDLGSGKFKGILFDLGFSTLQVEDPERGFSFSSSGPLDMRMDPSLTVSAADLIKVLNKGELNELFSKLGEERLAKRFAEALVSAREIKGESEKGKGICDTKELAAVIEKAASGKKGKIHPASRVFQALRIAVNDELNALREALPQALEVLDYDSRITVISFHSLEDRIVKNIFKQWEESGLGDILNKKPILPNEDEMRLNPRSRSAKLRVFEYDNN